MRNMDFVVAEAGIRQLHARYVDAVWRQDIAAFGDCFAVDCEWRISGLSHRGRDQISSFMARGFKKFRRILLTFRTPVLEVGDGIASGRVYMSEQSVLASGQGMTAIGTYYERFVEQDDRWRFSWRLFHTNYVGPVDLSAPFFDNPEYGAPPAMPPLDAPSFDRSGLLTK